MNEISTGAEKKGFIAKHAKIATVIAVIFGATSATFGTLITAPSMMIGFGRLSIALPFFIVPVLCSRENRANLQALSKGTLAWCFVTGAFLFAHFFCWFSSVKFTDVASASVLMALHPLVVLVITVFFYKKKVSAKSVAAILAALLGGAIITGADLSTLAGGSMKGNLFALAAGLFMGLYFAAGDRAREHVKGTVYVMLVFFSCWVCFAVGMIVTQTPVFGYPMMDYVYIAILSVLCQIGTHAVFNLCIGHVSALYVSAWESADPVFSIALAAAVLQQIPTGYELLGCGIVVAALLYYNVQTLKDEAQG